MNWIKKLIQKIKNLKKKPQMGEVTHPSSLKVGQFKFNAGIVLSNGLLEDLKAYLKSHPETGFTGIYVNSEALNRKVDSD